MSSKRDYTEGMGHGKGYNILTGQPSIEYVTFTDKGTPGNNTGQKSTLLYKQITSSQELAVALDLNAELNVNASWFTAKGSLKAKILQSSASKINSYTTFGLIHVKVDNLIEDIKNPSLNQAALDLIKNETVAGFHRRAGHEYVSGIISGGELIITIEITSNDAETKKQVDAALNAAFSAADIMPTNSLEVSAEAKSNFSDLARTKNISIQVTCKREGGSGLLPTTIEEALICAKNFPDAVKSAATPIQAYCMPFELLPDYPGEMQQLVFQRQQRVLKSLWQQYTDALDMLSNVDYILIRPEQFDEVEIQTLKAGKKKLQERLDDITDRAQEYSHSPDKIKIADSEFPPIEVELPQRKASNVAGLLPTNTIAPGSEFTFETITLNAAGQVSNRQQCRNQQQRFTLVPGVDLEMVYVPAGSFTMGSPTSEAERRDNEGPQHNVTLEAFWLSKYPITQGQYQAIVGSNPAKFKGDARPVECVSWREAIAFCQRVSTQLNQSFTLPSEAQWEYACRGQASIYTPFYFGETITPEFVNYDGEHTYGNAPKGKYRKETTAVGSFPPNNFGLCDMHGNVWEWCLDTWHDNYAGAPIDGSAWQSQNENDNRVLRGGSWDFNPRYCRSAYRDNYGPVIQSNYFGFRVCLAVART
jgi:formylglycine-generating enzyme required for sulfatase activity